LAASLEVFVDEADAIHRKTNHPAASELRGSWRTGGLDTGWFYKQERSAT